MLDIRIEFMKTDYETGKIDLGDLEDLILRAIRDADPEPLPELAEGEVALSALLVAEGRGIGCSAPAEEGGCGLGRVGHGKGA